MSSEHIKTGELGEEIACKFLKNKGYKILDRNFRKKFGEIDIIAEKNRIINFVEVKTITAVLDKKGELAAKTFMAPEEKVDRGKLRRIGRAIKVYIEHRPMKPEWKFKVISVFFDPVQKMAKIRVIEDVVPE